MKNLRTYDVPVQHIKGAVIRWHMNVWEYSTMDREKLKREYNYTDDEITALVNRAQQDTKPAQRLVATNSTSLERWLSAGGAGIRRRASLQPIPKMVFRPLSPNVAEVKARGGWRRCI